MTVASETRKAGPYTGDGTVAQYPFAFKVFTSDQLLVTAADTDGNETQLDADTDYTVALNADQNADPGGSITLAAGPLAVGYLLVIEGNIDSLQLTSIPNLSGFYPKVIENALDKLTMLFQQAGQKVIGALRLNATETAFLAGGKPIKNIGAPVADSDAATAAYVRERIVNAESVEAGQLRDDLAGGDARITFPKYSRISVPAEAGEFRAKEDGAGFWQSIVDNNTTNPDAGGAGWLEGSVHKLNATGAIKFSISELFRYKVTPEMFGARGDGIADDTIPMQNAIDYSVNNSIRLEIPPRRYRLTATLVVGSTIPLSAGSFEIVGARRSVINGKGTELLWSGTGYESLIKIQPGASRNYKIAGLKLICSALPTNDTYCSEYGLFFSGTAFTIPEIEDITAIGARKTIHNEQLIYSNGEFAKFRRVSGEYTQVFYSATGNVGQGFNPLFEQCGMLAVTNGAALDQGSPEYVAFDFGNGQGGFGLHSIDFNSTIVEGQVDPVNYAPVIYHRDRGSTGPVRFVGGRNEGYTTITDNQHASSGGDVVYEGVEFSKLYASQKNPLIKGGVDSGACKYTYRDCSIPVGKYGFIVRPSPLDGSQYIFDHSRIAPYGGSSAGASPANMIWDVDVGRRGEARVEFIGCQKFGSAGSVQIIDRVYENGGGPVRQGHNAGSLLALTGAPENLVTNSDFGGLSCPGWGGTTPLLVWQQSGANVNPFGSSPGSTYVIFGPGFSRFQDIKPITGANQECFVTLRIRAMAGNTNNRLTITLSHDLTGEIYDRATIGSSGNGAVPIIQMSARSSQTSGNFRLTISTPVSNTANISASWLSLHASGSARSSYIYSPAAVLAWTHDWESAQHFRANGRLQLPYVPATFAARVDLPNMQSDICVEQTRGALVIYNPITVERWNQLKPQSSNTAGRPAGLTALHRGQLHFDTTLAAAGKPIWWTGTQWVDATGTVV